VIDNQELSRTFPCPQCPARAGEPCVSNRVTIHGRRLDKALNARRRMQVREARNSG